MFNENGYSLSDIAAVSGNKSNGLFGDDGGTWIILLFLIILFAGGRGFGLGNETNGDVQRSFDNSYTTSKLDNISSAICSGFNGTTVGMNANTNAIQNSLVNGFNNVTTQMNAIATQQQNCCCETKGLIAELNYNLASQECNTRQSVNDGVRSILDAINAQTISAKDDKIADLSNQVTALNLAASQQAQNNAIISALRTPTPIPAYITSSPFASASYGCGCSCAS